jgi:multiple sugar transport system substrate-binding protein
VAAEDGIGPVKGVYIPPHVAPVTAFVRSAGGAVVDDPLDPSTLTLSGDEARTAVQEVATLVRDSTVAPTEEELGKAGPAEMFARGRLGMYVGTREDLPRLRAAQGLLFDVMPLPALLRSQSVSQVKGWCLNSASDDVGPAADFITFAVGPKGARIAARSDVIVPSNLSVVNSPAFTQPGELPRSSGAFFTSLRRSDAMPYSPAWPEVAALADRELGVLFTRSDIDLDTSLERRLTRLDRRSERLFRAAEPRGDEG